MAHAKLINKSKGIIFDVELNKDDDKAQISSSFA